MWLICLYKGRKSLDRHSWCFGFVSLRGELGRRETVQLWRSRPFSALFSHVAFMHYTRKPMFGLTIGAQISMLVGKFAAEECCNLAKEKASGFRAFQLWGSGHQLGYNLTGEGGNVVWIPARLDRRGQMYYKQRGWSQYPVFWSLLLREIGCLLWAPRVVFVGNDHGREDRAASGMGSCGPHNCSDSPSCASALPLGDPWCCRKMVLPQNCFAIKSWGILSCVNIVFIVIFTIF